MNRQQKFHRRFRCPHPASWPKRQSSISTWIYTITRNVCLTALRRRNFRLDSLEQPELRREVERRVAAIPTVAERSGADELLNRLPPKYRPVVALFYMQEKSYDEVACMLNLPVATVKNYLFRARKSLAETIARERNGKGGA